MYQFSAMGPANVAELGLDMCPHHFIYCDESRQIPKGVAGSFKNPQTLSDETLIELDPTGFYGVRCDECGTELRWGLEDTCFNAVITHEFGPAENNMMSELKDEPPHDLLLQDLLYERQQFFNVRWGWQAGERGTVAHDELLADVPVSLLEWIENSASPR
jgi:hypothetical protein